MCLYVSTEEVKNNKAKYFTYDKRIFTIQKDIYQERSIDSFGTNNYEAPVSELQENLEEMFTRY